MKFWEGQVQNITKSKGNSEDILKELTKKIENLQSDKEELQKTNIKLCKDINKLKNS